ncbi:MAG: trypsin-like peptidase domain-containing protein [Pseudomonadales bacterium]
MVESILLTATPITTYAASAALTNATGFFFERSGRLYLVTSRHVFFDAPSGHSPDRVEIELHTDRDNLARSAWFSIPLYDRGSPLWRQGSDAGGEVDVAVIEINRSALPATAYYAAFTERHLAGAEEQVEVGSPLLIVGFPLGFHDTLHHLPVVRQAINASTFAFRFGGEGYFLTDGRTHRGISGAAVVRRTSAADLEPPWRLLGIHSARLDLGTRELLADEALGLNVAWFADILLTLTDGGPSSGG